MTLQELTQHIKSLLSEKEEEFNMADGADSNFHYLEGYVECLEQLLTTIEGN